MFAYYTRTLSIHMAAKITSSLFCCLNLFIGAQGIETVFKLPKATTLLKQPGIHKKHKPSIAAITQAAKLTAFDGAAKDRFGSSISIDGDTVVIGAAEHKVGANNSQGAAYVFSRNQGGADQWGLLKQLTASDGAA